MGYVISLQIDTIQLDIVPKETSKLEASFLSCPFHLFSRNKEPLYLIHPLITFPLPIYYY